MKTLRNTLAAAFVGMMVVSGVANAQSEAQQKALDDLKRSISKYPEITYAMMGDVIFLHGTTEHVPELGNIIGKLMQIEGISEVRSNIFRK